VDCSGVRQKSHCRNMGGGCGERKKKKGIEARIDAARNKRRKGKTVERSRAITKNNTRKKKPGEESLMRNVRGHLGFRE